MMDKGDSKSFLVGVVVMEMILTPLTIGNSSSVAQIVPDNSLGGESSLLNAEIIEGGARRGGNLFHSFSQFSIGEGQSIKFANPSNVTRIFSRVTGDRVSEIHGVLGVLGNADLFLLNPHGIIFGANARLDVKGSFIGTTANSVLFPDGIFSASNPRGSTLLTVSVPIGLEFVQGSGQILNYSQAINPDITLFEGQSPNLDSFLQSPTGLLTSSTNRTLALIGGDVILDGGRVTSIDGHIELGGVQEGLVSLTPSPSGWNFSYDKISTFKDIHQLNQGVVQLFAVQNPATVQIQAQRINISGGGAIFTLTRNDFIEPPSELVQRGLTRLSATEAIQLDTNALVVNATVATASAGDIIIDSPRLSLNDNSMIATNSTIIGNINNPSQEAAGRSGNIIINAPQAVEIKNGSIVTAATFALGNAGIIRIDTQNLTLQEKSKISAETFEQAQGGGIFISATNINLRNEAEISAMTFSNREGGDIEIQSNTLNIDTESQITAATEDIGNAGRLVINTSSLRIGNGSSISANTTAQGKGGDLIIKSSDLVEVSGIGTTISSDSQAGGDAGNLTLELNRLVVRDAGTISAIATGTGRAGNINIKANAVELNAQGEISTNNEQVNGGNININVHDLLLLRYGGQISTNAGENGGNITINARFIVALPQEDSDIAANAITGRGGNISITTQGIFGSEPRDKPTPFSDITASSEFGLAGTVNINNAQIEPQQSIQELPDKLLDVANLIDQSLCSVGRGSELTVTGRGGLPSSPQQTLAADNLWEDWRPVEAGAPRAQRTPSSPARPETETTPREFQGWTVNARGNVVLTAAAIVVTPQGDWLPPPGCQHLIKSLQ